VSKSHNKSCAGFEELDLPAAPVPVVQSLSIDNTSSPPQDKPLAAIESALDALLTALLMERERLREAAQSKPMGLRVFSCADLVEMPVLSDQEAWQERILERPVAGALELAIHEIGEVLFKKGGTDLMRKSLEHVASSHPKTYGKRVSICDVQWDGIGGKWWH
jgi:hypothetical protein